MWPLASEEAALLLRALTGWVGGRLLFAEVGGNRCGGRGAAKERRLRRCDCRRSLLPSVALSAGENGTVSGPLYVCAHDCRCLFRIVIDTKRNVCVQTVSELVKARFTDPVALTGIAPWCLPSRVRVAHSTSTDKDQRVRRPLIDSLSREICQITGLSSANTIWKIQIMLSERMLAAR